MSSRSAAAQRRRLTLAGCCGVHGVQDGLTSALYVILPTLAQAFGLTYAQVGFVKAVNNTAMTLLELPSGMLSEWLGERALLVFGLLCAGCRQNLLDGVIQTLDVVAHVAEELAAAQVVERLEADELVRW